MKFNKFVGTAGLGALSVALLSTSALAQSTPLNVPKSVDEYKAAVDAGDACTETYEKWLNRAQCEKKLEAETYKSEELDPAKDAVTEAKTEYDLAVKADQDAPHGIEDGRGDEKDRSHGGSNRVGHSQVRYRNP